MKKKSAKIDRWQGVISERTAFLVKTTDELKSSVEKLHENVDTKFKDLKECVDQKFEKHNLHHVNVEKKYTKLFLIIGALTAGSILSNPEGPKFVLGLITKLIGLF